MHVRCGNAPASAETFANASKTLPKKFENQSVWYHLNRSESDRDVLVPDGLSCAQNANNQHDSDQDFEVALARLELDELASNMIVQSFRDQAAAYYQGDQQVVRKALVEWLAQPIGQSSPAQYRKPLVQRHQQS